MILELMKAVVGLLGLMALWFAVQSYLRRRNRLPVGHDVLEDMAEGCGNCGEHGNCQRKEKHACR
ncbi:MAG: hypothetical protein JNK48_23290 [Bryobacterales bacterium]|nr:hypothetical protein [Bryobacterales bacterium]